MDMEIEIELGHRVLKNIKPTKEGYTHDWTAFVRGANGNEIKYIVEKVIFHLPDSYPDPERIKARPPFSVSESTSQDSSIEIEVHFCKEAKLKKVNYMYDICINDDEDVLWTRKLTFPNPSKEFKEKLLLAGGKLVVATAPPMLAGELLKCKLEPVDDGDDVVLNTSTQDTDNLQNSFGTLNTAVQDANNLQNFNVDNEKTSRFNNLSEENETLKNANMELRDKINLQEKLRTSYEEQVSHYETNILNANVVINQLKRKIETDEREIYTLELQLQMLKNKLLRMKSHPPKCPEEKNEELNTFAAIVKEKENITQTVTFTSSGRSQNSPLFEDTFDSINDERAADRVESRDIPSDVQESSLNRPTVKLTELCNASPESHPFFLSKNETEPFTSSATSSFHSTNICDVEKYVEDNSVDANASQNKSDIPNNDAEDFVRESSVEANSSRNTSEIKVMNAENSQERNSVNSSASLHKFNSGNEDVEKAIFGSMVEYLKAPETITVDAETSPKEVVVKANAALNKFNKRNNDVDEIVEGKSSDPSIIKMQSCNTNETQNIFDMQEQHASPIERICNEPHDSHCEESRNKLSDCSDIASLLALSDKFLLNKKQRKILEERFLERKSFVTPISINALHADPCSTNEIKQQFEAPDEDQQISLDKNGTIRSFNANHKENDLKLLDSGNNTSFPFKSGGKLLSKSGRKKLMKKLKKIRIQLENQLKYPELDQQVSLNERKKIESTYKKIIIRLNKHDAIYNNMPKPKKKKKSNTLWNSRKVFQNKNYGIHSVCKKSHQGINEVSLPKLILFLTEHWDKLAAELGRIKNSEFNTYNEGTNPLFLILGKIDTGPILDAHFAQYVQSLIDYFSDPQKLDMPSLIFLIVDYLYRDRPQHESLFTHIQNQELYVYLPYSESCIVRAVVEVEKKSLPHLNGLGRNILNIIHKVIISKKKMPPNGLASLCRVFMEMCKCYNDRWEALFLCCELLRSGHPLAPYLINTLAAIWRDPFHLHNAFSVDETMLLSSIFYGMQEKPLLMDSDLWIRTLKLRSAYFPHPLITDPHKAIQFLTSEIVSRCSKGFCENLLILEKPLVIFVSSQNRDWKMRFRYEYILPNLMHFAKCFNEHGFDLFCNLLVDIFSFCNGSLYEELLQFFTNSSLHQGSKFLQDSAAVAVLKYIGITDKGIPPLLRGWFLRNKDNPKLANLEDLYCRKVMESHDSILLWNDIIIL